MLIPWVKHCLIIKDYYENYSHNKYLELKSKTRQTTYCHFVTHLIKLDATHFKMSLKVDFIVYFVSCQFHTSYALLVNSMIMMMMKINIIVAIDMTSAMTAASYCVTQGSIWALCSSREWLKFVLAKTHFGRILCTIFLSAIVSEIGQNFDSKN